MTNLSASEVMDAGQRQQAGPDRHDVAPWFVMFRRHRAAQLEINAAPDRPSDLNARSLSKTREHVEQPRMLEGQ
jgi:hypothetical protein